MKCRVVFKTFCLAAIAASTFSVNALESTQLDHLLKQYHSSELQQQQLRHQWQQEKAALDRQLEFYQEEKNVLLERIRQSKNKKSDVSAKREALAGQQSKLEQEAQQYQALLQQSTRQLESLWLQLPQPLKISQGAEFQQLINEKADLTERFTALINLMTEIDQFNRTINYSRQQLPLTGNQWQAEVIYLGLAQAYFRTADGEKTGIAWPTDTGWQWQLVPKWKDSINQAFEVYLEQSNPQLIYLPVRGVQ